MSLLSLGTRSLRATGGRILGLSAMDVNQNDISLLRRDVLSCGNWPQVNPHRTFKDVGGDNTCPSTVRGIDFIRDGKLNKGMAFTLEERQKLGIHGLIPPRFKTQEEQVDLCLMNLSRYTEDLNKYIYLSGLQERNERLFYRVLSENVEQMMPLVYTPTVGLACQKFGLIYRKPRGLFISIHDRGHIYSILRNWPEADIRAIVVTDGERILGLGDLGCYGMGIPVGKLALYTALAGVKPHQCLPILLDVGTNSKTNLEDAFYTGLRQNRVRGEEYDAFIDEFMAAVVARYGQNCLVQFEDFANINAFRLLEKYRDKYCVFNDDIQGTASVAVAGIIASMRVTKKQLKENIFVFQGAGEASIGIANLLVAAMQEEGCSYEASVGRIYMIDSRGLISTQRPEGGIDGHKKTYAKDVQPMKSIEEVVRNIKPTCLIGAAAIGGAFTPAVIKAMAEINERPIIFALSNPTSKAECTAEEAYRYTEGRCVFASGSPFQPVEYAGQRFEPGQGNNAYIFPGVGLGVIAAGIYHVSDHIFLVAAQKLAEMVREEDFAVGRVYPPLSDIRHVSTKIATRIAEYAYSHNMAGTYPEPADKEAFIKAQQYDYHYNQACPEVYSWPDKHGEPWPYAKPDPELYRLTPGSGGAGGRAFVRDHFVPHGPSVQEKQMTLDSARQDGGERPQEASVKAKYNAKLDKNF
ncbi:unnamed protein product [Cyprideis torosa]|uniref:Malic enzyme n=1 Tax=Cyprideis torosa TaxID=163714 RepID=A0A7R8W214_9CRUS|nr:unnamed protein product [Cyprideis torosa]CAG0881480.1 unnamed protein product [Cyprideis torosa]